VLFIFIDKVDDSLDQLMPSCLFVLYPKLFKPESSNTSSVELFKRLSCLGLQSSKPERIATMKEKEDFATEMVDNNDRRGTGVVFKRREPRSSNKKQSKSSTGSLEFCDFSDGEQDSTV
jgi:hypothetical protein